MNTTAVRNRALASLSVAALAALLVVAVPANTATAASMSYANSTPVAIPDGVSADCNSTVSNGVATSTITVPDAEPIADLRVSLAITHTWQSDLVVDLTSPTGSTVRLIDRVQRTINCGSNADDVIATLDDAAGDSVEDYVAPGANYAPMQPLSTFDGENSAGVWTLTVYDVSQEDVGTLDGWSLTIDSVADLAVGTPPAAVSEDAGSVEFVVARTGSTLGTDTVAYATADGTANAGSDYVSSAGTLTFAPGVTLLSVTVPLIDDGLPESDETFELVLSGASGTPTPTVGVARATATIVDNDQAPPAAPELAATGTDAGVPLFAGLLLLVLGTALALARRTVVFRR